MKMSNAVLPFAALGLLLAAMAITPITAADPPADRVKPLFESMRDGKYRGDKFPVLEWADIPALLALADGTDDLKSYLTNPLSSVGPGRCPEGVAALWLVEGLRKGGKYPSLNPRVTGFPTPGADRAKEQKAWEKAAAKAYKDWWAKVKDLPPAKAREVDPLADTGLNWS